MAFLKRGQGLIGIIGMAVLVACAWPAAPSAAAQNYNWTGIYVGGHVGGGWAHKGWVFVGPQSRTDHDSSSFIGGGQLGVNWQAPGIPFVWGLEGDGTRASSLDGQSTCPNPSARCRTEQNWLATVTGRFGYAFIDRALFYVKAGGAFTHDDYFVRFPSSGVFNEKASGGRASWTVGTGFEYGFWNNFSAKIEYNFMDFGNDRVDFHRINCCGGAFVETADIKQKNHVVKFGINYRFNLGPGKG